MKSARRKSATKKQAAEPMVRIVTTRDHNLSQKELSAVAAVQVTIQMALERLEAECPTVWVREIEMHPCPPNCKRCRTAA